MSRAGLIERRPAAPVIARTNWSVLRHQHMRWYVTGNSLSNIGTWLQNTAQIVLAYQLTRSTAGVGLVIGAQFISPLLLGPVAGAVADRFDRRLILIITQVGSAAVCATMAGLQSAGALGLTALVAGAFLVGVAFTFTLPAITAFVPTLVPKDEVRAALALNGVSSNVGRALAPILGVGVLATMGFGWAFASNAASFVALAAVLAGLRSRPHPTTSRAPLLDGFRIVRSTRRLQVILLIVAVSTVATDPPLVLGPSLAVLLGVNAASSAYFLAAFGIGTVIGSVMPCRRTQLSGAAGYLALLGAAIFALSIARTFWVALIAIAVAGASALLVGAATQSLMLSIAGPARAGRVMAIWAVAYVGSRPIATVADSWLAGITDARTSCAMLAMPSLAVAGTILCLKATARGRRWGARTLRGTMAVPAPAT